MLSSFNVLNAHISPLIAPIVNINHIIRPPHFPQEICETSPMSCMLNRNMIIRNGHNTSPEEAHLIESKSIYWVARQADAKEGIHSFLEKRPAQFPMDPFKDSPDWFPWWRETSTKSRL